MLIPHNVSGSKPSKLKSRWVIKVSTEAQSALPSTSIVPMPRVLAPTQDPMPRVLVQTVSHQNSVPSPDSELLPSAYTMHTRTLQSEVTGVNPIQAFVSLIQGGTGRATQRQISIHAEVPCRF